MAAKTWDNGGGDGLWSTPANWSDNAVPATTDALTFDGTSVANCTIDNVGTWSAGTISVAVAYSGNFIQNVPITISAGIALGSGANSNTWTMNADITNVGGSAITINGHGVFTRVSGSILGATFIASGGVLNLGVDATVGGTMTANAGSTVTGTGIITWTSGTCIVANSATFDTFGVTRLNLATAVAGGINIGTTQTAFQGVPIYVTGVAATTFTGAPYDFNVVSIVKASPGSVTIASTADVDIGASPTITTNGLTVNGELIVSGTLTYNAIAVGGATIFSVAAGGIVSGALTAINLNYSLTINATATFPAGVVLNINPSINTGLTITATAATFGTCTLTGSDAITFTIAAGTSITLAANQTFGSTGLVTVTGTLNLLGDFNLMGSLTTSAGSTLSGTATVKLTEGTFTMNATGTVSNTIGVWMNFTGGTARTFAGGDKTYAMLRRSGAGAGTLTITGTNTFVGAIYDNDGQVAHTITFPNVTTTVGGFFVRGSTGKLVTLTRTGAAGTFTLTTTGGRVNQVGFISVSNSTVDAAPAWYAGATPPSVNGGGNTNWNFSAAPEAGLLKQAAQVVM